MAEYIDKWPVVNKLIDLENEFQQYKPFHGFEHAMYRKICEAEIAIGKTPSADVVEVVHGRWVQVICHVEFEDGFVDRLYECCSRCHKPNGRKMTDYCPNCGADMRVGEEEKLESHSKAYVPDKNVGHIIPVNDLYDEDGE